MKSTTVIKNIFLDTLVIVSLPSPLEIRKARDSYFSNTRKFLNCRN